MNLSLCMIVKNEEELLWKSLSAARRWVDDIVIVDTGSTDQTKKIALNFTKKIYDFKWCNDFSAARNFALEQAPSDWVLVLDADELIVDFNVNDIRNIITVDQPVVGRIELINLTSNETGEQRFREKISRLFNRRLFHYKGVIHEQLVRKDGNPHDKIPAKITVEHSGYTQEVIQRTGKITRNINLLIQALERSPEEPYLLYQLGQAYFLAKNYQDAVLCFKRALDLPINLSLEYVKNMVETYGYALINSGSYEEALSLKKYELHFANSTDYLFLMGHVYMNNGRFLQAIEHFLQCIDNKEGKLEGINSYLPRYNIAVIYECLGYRTEAVSYYQKCGNYPAAIKRLREI